jgi:hypothetical protein
VRESERGESERTRARAREGESERDRGGRAAPESCAITRFLAAKRGYTRERMNHRSLLAVKQ